jgi:Domain of unknown function (DUF4175)
VVDILLHIRLAVLRGLTRLLLSIATVIHRFAESLMWCAGYTSLLLLGVLPASLMPQFAGLFWLGLLILLLRGIANVLRATRPAIDRELERAGKIPHRPLQLRDDRLFNPGKDLTSVLWQLAKAKSQNILSRLKLPAPKPFWVRIDPFALRLMIGILLVTGVTIAGPDALSRIKNGLWQQAAPSITSRRTLNFARRCIPDCQW